MLLNHEYFCPPKITHYTVYIFTQATSKLVLGPFTISPAQFYLPANEGVIPLSISFAPDKGVGEYSQQFNIACDNGQVMAFTVRGL